jgi:hypothetical protein
VERHITMAFVNAIAVSLLEEPFVFRGSESGKRVAEEWASGEFFCVVALSEWYDFQMLFSALPAPVISVFSLLAFAFALLQDGVWNSWCFCVSETYVGMKRDQVR